MELAVAYQLPAYVDFRARDLIPILGAYRFLSNDYETGSGKGLFHYAMSIFGPTLYAIIFLR